MSAALQIANSFAERGFRVRFETDDTWTLGVCTAFKDLGLVSVVVGPLHFNIEWAVC